MKIPKRFRWLLLGVCLPVMAPAQTEVPLKVQAVLAVKILKFCNSVSSLPGPSIQVGILYGDEGKSLKGELISSLKAIPDSKIQDKELVFKEMAYSDNLAEVLQKEKINVLYVVGKIPGKTGVIAAATQNLKIFSFGSVPEQVSEGLSVGFELAANKPQILLNAESVKKEGVSLQATFLRMVKVVN